MKISHVSKSIHLQAGMTTEVNQDFHDPNVAFVYANVQRRLTALVASIQIGTTTLKHANHFRLVTKCCMMHSPITIFVLQKQKSEKRSYKFECSQIDKPVSVSTYLSTHANRHLCCTHITHTA